MYEGINCPLAVLVGALNDRLLVANPSDVNPRQRKGVEIRSCLVGLLEPLLIGFATMQQTFEQKLDLPEILYQITSRFRFPADVFTGSHVDPLRSCILVSHFLIQHRIYLLSAISFTILCI